MISTSMAQPRSVQKLDSPVATPGTIVGNASPDRSLSLSCNGACGMGEPAWLPGGTIRTHHPGSEPRSPVKKNGIRRAVVQCWPKNSKEPKFDRRFHAELARLNGRNGHESPANHSWKIECWVLTTKSWERGARKGMHASGFAVQLGAGDSGRIGACVISVGYWLSWQARTVSPVQG